MTLTEFLLERIAEDEATAKGGVSCNYAHPGADVHHFGGHPDTFRLAECEAKRKVIDEINSLEAQIQSEWGVGPMDEDSIPGLQALALPYVNHPDFQPEWRL